MYEDDSTVTANRGDRVISLTVGQPEIAVRAVWSNPGKIMSVDE